MTSNPAAPDTNTNLVDHVDHLLAELGHAYFELMTAVISSANDTNEESL